MESERVQFSAIVVTLNESRRLPACLDSLAFCEQVIVVDLGSRDGCVSIAREHGAEVIAHERVPFAERVWREVLPRARHDWVILLDPDEVMPPGIEQELRAVIEQNASIGVVAIPIQNYFQGRPLRCTIWGLDTNKRPAVFHRERMILPAVVHGPREAAEGYRSVILPRGPGTLIRHYWMDTYAQLFEKHWRYIRHEGEARYHAGARSSWRRMRKETRRALKQNLRDHRGLDGGFTGVFLSFFYAGYVALGWLSLRRYERRRARR